MTERDPIDLDNCALEPIHLPGSIQPHGAMLVCETDGATIAFASANAASLLGLAHDSVLGRSLTRVLGEDGVHDLRNALAKAGPPPSCGVLPARRCPSGLFDVVAHEHGGRLIVEFEPASARSCDSDDTLDLAQALTRRLGGARDIDDIAATSVRLLRAALGYDRVMVYRFLHNDAGRVIAEAKRSDMHSFLNQHFPAADIPAQARRLYQRNWLRLIADARYSPVPLLAADPANATTVDMSYAHLRSVSPIHCEYLRNMGVVASLSISIVVDDVLWGLIACHHDSPRAISRPLRATAELFGRFVSLQIANADRRGDLHVIDTAARRLDELTRGFTKDQSIDQYLRQSLPGIAALIECDGAALVIADQWTILESAPERSELEAVLQMLERKAIDTVWSTNELRADAGLLTNTPRAAGVLSIPLSIRARDYLLLFRDEEAQTVTWAGPPMKTVVAGPNGPRLTPRGSFAAWREEVRGRARGWSEVDHKIADAIKTSLRDLALRHSEWVDVERTRAEQRRRMHHDELQHRVKNILALVKSIVTQTGVHAGNLQEYSSSLEGRLRALSYAHDQSLAFENGADLTALLEAETNLYRNVADGERIVIAGPRIGFTEQAFSSLALLIHEMMTNAAKYGALSTKHGRLAIRWHMTPDADCEISWIERSGPAVSAPTRRGFGSTLIESTMSYDLGGSFDIHYAAEGLAATFRIPARHITRAHAATPPVPICAQHVGRPLEGMEVLLLEDRALIAIDTENVLLQLGARHVTALPDVAQATALVKSRAPDVAVLDFNLSDGTSEALADLLSQLEIPFVFLTGYAHTTMIPARFANVPVIRKPVDLTGAGEILGDVVARHDERQFRDRR